jgi:hypothetical protein
MTKLYDKIQSLLLLILLIFFFTACENSTDEEVFIEQPKPEFPDFINNNFDSVGVWFEFRDTGSPTSHFTFHDGYVVAKDTSAVLMQDHFPAGYYKVGVRASGKGQVVMYQKQGKRLLTDLGVREINGDSLLGYDFFVGDSLNTIGFQIRSQDGIKVDQVCVGYYHKLF